MTEATDTMSDLKFSHKTIEFVFIGEPIAPPKPGTYDPAKWTPTTNRMYYVTFQLERGKRNLYWLKTNGCEVESGDCDHATLSEAKQIAKRYIDRMNSQFKVVWE